MPSIQNDMSRLIRIALSTRLYIIIPLLAGFYAINSYSSSYALGHFAALLLLFSILVFFSDFYSSILSSETGAFTTKFNLFFFPGTAVHELSHALAVVLTGGKVTNISLFNPGSTTLGYVRWQNPKGHFSFLRGLMVAIAPFFGCGILLVLIIKYYSGINPLADINPSPYNILGYIPRFLTLPIDVVASMTRDYSMVVLLYIFFTVGTGVAPSSKDFQGILQNVKSYPLSFIISIILLFAIYLFPQLLSFLTKYLYVILLVSISFLIWASTLLVYFNALKRMKIYLMPIPIIILVVTYNFFFFGEVYSGVVKAVVASFVSIYILSGWG